MKVWIYFAARCVSASVFNITASFKAINDALVSLYERNAHEKSLNEVCLTLNIYININGKYVFKIYMEPSRGPDLKFAYLENYVFLSNLYLSCFSFLSKSHI